MDRTVTQLIYLESGGLTGLQRGCTVEPSALPEVPRTELQSLLQQTTPAQVGASSPAVPGMPDMQTYTLELVMQASSGDDSTSAAAPQHRVLRYPASDVPGDLSKLFDFLREQARPLKPR